MTVRKIIRRIDTAPRANPGHPVSWRERHGASVVDARTIEHGARAIEAVIAASSKLQRLRDRITALEHALARVGERRSPAS